MKNKQKREPDGMSEEDLCYFMSYPGHPRWRHRLCNPFVTVPIAILAVVLIGCHYDASALLIIFIASFSLAICSQLIWMYCFMGHGTSMAPKPRFVFAGIPNEILSVIFLMLTSAAIFIALDTFFIKRVFPVEIDSLRDYKFISLVLLISLCTVLLSWRYHIYYVTFYRDERAVHNHYLEKEWQEIDIYLKFKELRIEGELPWKF